jgi:hypothetical protein
VDLERDLERSLRRALRFRRLRSYLLPLFLVAAGLWFFLHPLIAAVAKDLAAGRPVDWGEMLRRAVGALVAALSPFAIVAFLAFVLLVYLLTFLLDWWRVRCAVDRALESFHTRVHSSVEEEGKLRRRRKRPEPLRDRGAAALVRSG